jgi:glutamyl-tRNA synthetase
MTVRVRIAPSPTGDPHVGTAYIALFNRAFARQQGGQFLLRIEDTDRTRCTPESEKMIFEALRWLGLTWDEGPDVGGPCGPYRQSERLPMYREHAERLVASGAAYWCACTPERLDQLRKEQQAAKLPPRYDGRCRDLGITMGVLRLRVPLSGELAFDDLVRGRIAFQADQIDDQVLLKTDGFPTYHLANVVDDRLMGITHVMRAEEWIPSVPKHLLLYRAFGWEPPRMAHLPLLRNPDRSKISKRKQPTSLNWYREQGVLPEALINFLGLMGFSLPDGRETFGFEDMARGFAFDRITTTGPVFDLKKLEWLNGTYIRALLPEALADRLGPYGASGQDRARVQAVLPLVQERLKRLSEWGELTGFFFQDPPVDAALLKGKHSPEVLRAMLVQAAAALEVLPDFSPAAMESLLRSRQEALGWKTGDYFMALRIAVTGRTATPPLTDTIAVLGREVAVRRIRAAARGLGCEGGAV